MDTQRMKNARVRRLRNLRRRKGQCIYCGKDCKCETSKNNKGNKIQTGSSETSEATKPRLERNKTTQKHIESTPYEDF